VTSNEQDRLRASMARALHSLVWVSQRDAACPPRLRSSAARSPSGAAGEQLVGFVVADELLLAGVPAELALHRAADVEEVHRLVARGWPVSAPALVGLRVRMQSKKFWMWGMDSFGPCGVTGGAFWRSSGGSAV